MKFERIGPTPQEIIAKEAILRDHHIKRRSALRQAAKNGKVELVLPQLSEEQPRITIRWTAWQITLIRAVDQISKEESSSVFKLEMAVEGIEKTVDPAQKLDHLGRNLPATVADLHNLAEGLPIILYRTRKDLRKKRNPLAII